MDQKERLDYLVQYLCEDSVVYKDAIDKCENAVIAPLNCNLQRAASVAVCAQEMAKQGNVTKGENLELIYLRKSQAEREREARLQKEEAEIHG